MGKIGILKAIIYLVAFFFASFLGLEIHLVVFFLN